MVFARIVPSPRSFLSFTNAITSFSWPPTDYLSWQLSLWGNFWLMHLCVCGLSHCHTLPLWARWNMAPVHLSHHQLSRASTSTWLLKSRWGKFVDFMSTPSYSELVILQILPLCFHEHVLYLIRHLQTRNLFNAPRLLSIRDPTDSRKGNTTVSHALQFRAPGEQVIFFTASAAVLCKCFPVAMAKALWSKSSQREAGSPLLPNFLHRQHLPHGPSQGPCSWPRW